MQDLAHVDPTTAPSDDVVVRAWGDPREGPFQCGSNKEGILFGLLEYLALSLMRKPALIPESFGFNPCST